MPAVVAEQVVGGETLVCIAWLSSAEQVVSAVRAASAQLCAFVRLCYCAVVLLRAMHCVQLDTAILYFSNAYTVSIEQQNKNSSQQHNTLTTNHRCDNNTVPTMYCVLLHTVNCALRGAVTCHTGIAVAALRGGQVRL